jgi:hypothetical protein
MTSAAAEAILDAMLQALRDDGDRALCDALDMLSQRTRQNKFRHAAAIVRGIKLGRRAIDDRAALLRIEGFPPARRAGAVNTIARKVAGAGATATKIESTERRLRRKRKTDKNLLSAESTS